MRVLVFSVLFAFGISGCQCPEMKAMSTAWKVIGPEYRAYIANDPNKTQEQKDNRFATVDLLDQAIKQYEAK